MMVLYMAPDTACMYFIHHTQTHRHKVLVFFPALKAGLSLQNIIWTFQSCTQIKKIYQTAQNKVYSGKENNYVLTNSTWETTKYIDYQ